MNSFAGEKKKSKVVDNENSIQFSALSRRAIQLWFRSP